MDFKLFHEERFKFTPAIGGKNRGDKNPQYVSHVWHRMLPLGGSQYLEIVTIFEGDNKLWNNNKAIFEKEITKKDLIQIWGF